MTDLSPLPAEFSFDDRDRLRLIARLYLDDEMGPLTDYMDMETQRAVREVDRSLRRVIAEAERILVRLHSVRLNATRGTDLGQGIDAGIADVRARLGFLNGVGDALTNDHHLRKREAADRGEISLGEAP